MSKEAETFQSFILETDSAASMEPEIGEGEIPTGWSVETAVKKDGSKTLYYYCQGTGQHFFSYSGLIRYVEYAKRKQVGIYELSRKSIKRQRKVEEDSKVLPSKKRFSSFSGLSIPKKPSVPNSSTVVDQSKVEEEIRATESKKALSVLSIPKEPSNSLTSLDQVVEYESTTSSESSDEEDEEDEDYVPESDCDDFAESDTIDAEKEIVKEEIDDLKAP